MSGEQMCPHCEELFIPRYNVPNQKYCSNPECQKARKRRWNRQRLQKDSDYKENKQNAQQKWRLKNPDYWRNYRKTHPQYVEKNRQQQKIRNKKRNKHKFGTRPPIAKTDECCPSDNEEFLSFALVALDSAGIAKTDECFPVFMQSQHLNNNSDCKKVLIAKIGLHRHST